MKKMSKILKSKFLSLLTSVFLFSQNCYSVLDLKRIRNNKIIKLIKDNEKYSNFLTKHNYSNGYFTFAVDALDNNTFIVINKIFDNNIHSVGEIVSKMRFCGMNKYKIDDVLNILNSENFEEFEEPFIESIIFSENSKLPIMHESANVLRIYMEKDVEEGDKFFYIIPDSEKSISLDNLILVQKGMRGKKEITRKFKFGPFFKPFGFAKDFAPYSDVNVSRMFRATWAGMLLPVFPTTVEPSKFPNHTPTVNSLVEPSAIMF